VGQGKTASSLMEGIGLPRGLVYPLPTENAELPNFSGDRLTA
jgi:hypothetical protein